MKELPALLCHHLGGDTQNHTVSPGHHEVHSLGSRNRVYGVQIGQRGKVRGVAAEAFHGNVGIEGVGSVPEGCGFYQPQREGIDGFFVQIDMVHFCVSFA